MERSSFRGGAGYWLLAKDGGVFAFGDAQFFGPNRNQGNDIAGMGATATGNGYWTVDDDGDVFAYGDAVDYGSRPGPEIDNISGFSARAQGDGYWMVARDGSVYAFGGAKYFGSANTVPLVRPIVGMAATPSGQGYWLIAGDGGVFAYGDAPFFGSTGSIRLARPIVDFGPSPDGKGYRFIGTDGGVFAYGTAGFFGSTGAMRLNKQVVGFSATASGNGYWLVGEDGGVFSFGDAQFYGSTGSLKLNSEIVAIVATPQVKVSPVARDDAATVAEDGSVTVDVEGNDTHLLPASVSVATQPAHGTASVSGGKVVYSPAANYNGPDTLTYKLTDTVGHAATATVTITVTAVNDAPTISDIANQATPQGTTTNAVAFTVGDVDTGAAGLTVSGSSSNPALVPNANIGFGGSGASRSVAVTPLSGQSGTATITVTVSDGAGGTASDSFVVTVNDLPTISNVTDQAVNEDTATSAVPITIGDTETAVGSLTMSGSSSNTTLVPNANIVFGGSGASRTVTVTPAANQSGTTTITVTVTDANTGAASDTFVLTVNAVNDLPTISDTGDQVTNEDTATGALPITVGDVETAAASLTMSGSSSNTTLVPNANIVFGGSGAARTVTVTPAANQNGTATITVTVTDADTGAASDTFVLTVNAVNDPPTMSVIADLAVDENGVAGPLNFTVTDPDSGDTLSVTGGSSNQTLVPDANIDIDGAGTNRTVTVTPVLNESGVSTITLTVDDGNGGSDSETFILTVAVLDQPVAVDDVVDADLINIILTGIDVLANDSGLSDGPVTVEIVSGSLLGTEGTANVLGNTIHFLTVLDLDGDDLITFQYKVTDDDGDFAIGTVTVQL